MFGCILALRSIVSVLSCVTACWFSRDLHVARDLGQASFWPVLHVFFSIRSLTFNPHAKFEVCSFTRSRDFRWSQNLKSRSRDLRHTSFWPVSHFSGLACLTLNTDAKFEVCIFSRSRDIRGSQSLKVARSPLWPNFVFLNYHLVVPGYASNFNLIGLTVWEILQL